MLLESQANCSVGQIFFHIVFGSDYPTFGEDEKKI